MWGGGGLRGLAWGEGSSLVVTTGQMAKKCALGCCRRPRGSQRT